MMNALIFAVILTGQCSGNMPQRGRMMQPPRGVFYRDISPEEIRSGANVPWIDARTGKSLNLRMVPRNNANQPPVESKPVPPPEDITPSTEEESLPAARPNANVIRAGLVNEIDYVSAVNEIRMKNNLPALQSDTILRKNTEYNNYWQNKYGKVGHYDKMSVGQCAVKCASIQRAIELWMNDPACKQIILVENASRIGVSQLGDYWTLDIK